MSEAEIQALARGEFLKQLSEAERGNCWVILTTRSGKEHGGRVQSLGTGAVELSRDSSHSVSVSMLVIESVEVRYQ